MNSKMIVALAVCLQPPALGLTACDSPTSVKIQPELGAAAQGMGTAKQIRKHTAIQGVNAVQLNWWFNHIADRDGAYWRSLSPNNTSIRWDVSLQQAQGLIGSVFVSEQAVGGEPLEMRLQYQDWSTVSRMNGILPALPIPPDYTPPYPTPTNPGDVNGFNHNMLILDNAGYVPGRILVSFVNTGNDDTAGSTGDRSVDVYVTYYLSWMEGPNRPPSMDDDGYCYADGLVDGLWANFEATLQALPASLPAWWNADSQDDIARQNGYTNVSVVENGVLPGLRAKHITWFFNHIGDTPGTNYVKWAPSNHRTIGWVPGCSPAEVHGSNHLPQDDVVVGAMSIDLQGPNLVRSGFGVVWLPHSISPVPGFYRYMNNLSPGGQCGQQYTQSPSSLQLVHSWDDVPGGAVWRDSLFFKLPLGAAVTQSTFQFEHGWYEGASAKDKLRDMYKDRHQGSP